jgi:acetyl esterase/lipase
VDSGPTHEDRLINVPVAADRSTLIRQYGGARNCVIFFPGQHGGISTYERILFPAIRQAGAAIYALSYPGQDGAQGRSHRATILKDVAVAIAAIGRETSCQPNNAVFVGRSLGASVAVYAAQDTQPKGILLDGVGLTLTDAIHAAIERHTLMRPWVLLPLTRVVQDESLVPVIRSLKAIPIVIFQGTNDQVTPFMETQARLAHEDNVRFFAVNGAAHNNAYMLAQDAYTKQLADLMAR